MLKNVFLNKMYLPLKNSLVAIQSSNINEVIRSVLKFLFFLTIRFHKYKKAQNVIKTIQFFNRSHYSIFRSFVSKYIY